MDIRSGMPLLAAIRAGQAAAPAGGVPAASTAAPSSPAGPAAASPFSNVLKNALQSVSESQNQVSRLQRDFQLGKPDVTLEQTMVAMQKAQLEFQAALTVRNRMVAAYTDIMNMTV